MKDFQMLNHYLISSLQEFGFIVRLLHLENKRTIFDINLSCIECGRVGVKAPVITLLPSVVIECVEVISPVQGKLLGV